MKSLAKVVMVALMVLGMVATIGSLSGCGETSSTGSKMSGKGGDKMSGDKMSGDKMGDGKDKMSGDKMSGDKMGGKMDDKK